MYPLVPGIQIRHAIPQDAVHVGLVLRSVLSPNQYHYERNIGAQGCLNFVATSVDHSVVGFSSLLLDASPDTGPDVWRQYPLYVGVMAVAPAWQRRGIGSQLLRRTIEEARRERPHYAFTYLEVEHNNSAIRLYERLGFEKLGENKGSWLMRRSTQLSHDI
ncbi:N-acetyltransferase [Corallococcus sp. CA047B]|uniref:GNAT family N-acetyltransferase n=1 Tax=Corallococcus sp. CA047B TaxID=2316729 RepID=UPI000EA40779|nr:N-acetyltransferase [Corallococcus sp. CA047B]RKH19816.1 N-acetyltransferase [Corallococcus sp. CA047B]